MLVVEAGAGSRRSREVRSFSRSSGAERVKGLVGGGVSFGGWGILLGLEGRLECGGGAGRAPAAPPSFPKSLISEEPLCAGCSRPPETSITKRRGSRPPLEIQPPERTRMQRSRRRENARSLASGPHRLGARRNLTAGLHRHQTHTRNRRTPHRRSQPPQDQQSRGARVGRTPPDPAAGKKADAARSAT